MKRIELDNKYYRNQYWFEDTYS